MAAFKQLLVLLLILKIIHSEKCVINEDAQNALQRSKSPECREKISRIACELDKKKELTKIARTCRSAETKNHGTFLGCYEENNQMLLHFYFGKVETIEKCTSACLRLGFQIAGFDGSNTCTCGDRYVLEASMKLPDSQCELQKCITVYDTGLADLDISEPSHASIGARNSARIVFFLQLNGRNVRQIKRMLKLIYKRQHYYLIHVDASQHFMYREMLKLEQKFNRNKNFCVLRERMRTFWCSTAMLTLTLNALRKLTRGQLAHWKWDFFYNLSESDFPLKSVESLELLFGKYQDYSFLHYYFDIPQFVESQGMDYIFTECDGHMWRIGKRQAFPDGLTIAGGADWFALNRHFADFAANSEEGTVKEIRKLWTTLINPTESFFHTLAQMTHFCNQTLNSNFKFVNWKKNREGCSCKQETVDWCRCSPHVFKTSDWPKLLASEGSYFGRKFDSAIDQGIIGLVEEKKLGHKSSKHHLSFDSTWLNLYHFADLIPAVNNVGITVMTELAMKALWLKLPVTCDCSSTEPLIRELHAFRENDQSSMKLIIQFEHRCYRKLSVIAILVEVVEKEMRNEYLKNFPYFLNYSKVGTDYDVKEKVFRNFLGVLDTDSQIMLAQVWTKKYRLSDSKFPLKVEWVNQKGITIYTKTIITTANKVNHHSLPLNSLKTFGIWSVRFSFEHQFPVFAIDHELIRRLVPTFYKILDICIDKYCHETHWSSFYPDPKSEFE